MNPPNLFVGSSTEGKAVAEAIQSGLRDVADAKVWSQGIFSLNQSYLQSLEAALADSDFAVLVLSPDDAVTSRGRKQAAPRDNVMFELGLFLGYLGRNRAFFVYDQTADLKIPSDLLGITAATYRPHIGGELEPALGHVCTQIKKNIKKFGPRPRSPGLSSPELATFDAVPRVDGVWAGFRPGGQDADVQTSTLRIEQFGAVIHAVVERKASSGPRLFKYEGKIVSGQIVLFFEEESARGYNLGTMVLALSADLKSLVGKSTYFDHDTNEVVATPRRYVRRADP